MRSLHEKRKDVNFEVVIMFTKHKSHMKMHRGNITS